MHLLENLSMSDEIDTNMVMAAAREMFDGDEEAVNRWLNKPSITLGRKTPVSLLVTPDGRQVVFDLIVRLQRGMIS